MNVAIIAAAGAGKRMGGDRNKVFLVLDGVPLVVGSCRKLAEAPSVDALVIAAAPAEVKEMQMLLDKEDFCKPWQVVAGGGQRQDSIWNALLQAPAECEFVLVHDAARPLVSEDEVEAVMAAARKYKAAGLAVPVKDTIKQADPDGFVVSTPERSGLWAIQTPQVFSYDLLQQAYDRARRDGFYGTDDAGLVERLGIPVKLVPGSYRNIKITTREDIQAAKAITGKGGEIMRVGMGYDVHRLVPGRKLILGGVDIPYEQGLDGHSDADVLLHAIKDALLGAAALGDIGRHFPDTDPAYKGASSCRLLERVHELLAEAGYRPVNVDATVIAEKPKLAPHIATMNANIARILQIPVECVNVKATTTEKLGFTGRREGIAAQAVALVCTK